MCTRWRNKDINGTYCFKNSKPCTHTSILPYESTLSRVPYNESNHKPLKKKKYVKQYFI